jgi:hypothetical protein
VVGLTPAKRAKSRCEMKRSSRNRLSFAPTNLITRLIVTICVHTLHAAISGLQKD